MPEKKAQSKQPIVVLDAGPVCTSSTTFPPNLGAYCFKAVLRNGDNDAGATSDPELSVGGVSGQLNWGTDAQGYLNTNGLVAVTLSGTPGGGDLSVTWHVGTAQPITYGGKKYENITALVVQAIVYADSSGSAPWTVTWQNVVVTFFDEFETGYSTADSNGTPCVSISAGPFSLESLQARRREAGLKPSSGVGMLAQAQYLKIVPPAGINMKRFQLTGNVSLAVSGPPNTVKVPDFGNAMIGAVYVYASACSAT